MTKFDPLSVITPPVVPVLVCESGRRWKDAVLRFVVTRQESVPRWGFVDGKRFKRSDADPIPSKFNMRVEQIELPKVRALVNGLSTAVVLWETTAENLQAVALTIAQIGAGRTEVLQIVALDGFQRLETRRIKSQMLELPVAASVDAPEQLHLLSRLIDRRFSNWPVSNRLTQHPSSLRS